jgi:hypothetical protein
VDDIGMPDPMALKYAVIRSSGNKQPSAFSHVRGR